MHHFAWLHWVLLALVALILFGSWRGKPSGDGMPDGPQGQSPFFQVRLWHLFAMIGLFALALYMLISHLPLPIPLTGDYIMVAASGLGVVLFGWNFYSQRS